MRYQFRKRSDFPGGELSGKVLVWKDTDDLTTWPLPPPTAFFLLSDLDPVSLLAMTPQELNQWAERVIPRNISLIDLAPLFLAAKSGALASVEDVLAALNQTEFSGGSTDGLG